MARQNKIDKVQQPHNSGWKFGCTVAFVCYM